MDRRTKQRLDLQLVCRIGPSKVLSTPISSADVLVTQNFSRTGILLRWLPTIPLPSIGVRLTVDVELPSLPGRQPRAMRCTAEVVRIDGTSDRNRLVGMTIGKIRFVQAREDATRPDLESIPPATTLLN